MAELSKEEIEEHDRKLAAWIRDTVGVPDELLKSLKDRDDDWTFVIKIHGIIEAALNQMILGKLVVVPIDVDNPYSQKISDIISRLSVDGRASKLAFIKAMDLLPDD